MVAYTAAREPRLAHTMWHRSSVLIVVLLLALDAHASWAGAIIGAVTLPGPPPAPRKFPITIDQYVCGDAKRMALDVDKALRQVIATHGNLSPAEADRYVADMVRAGRYQRDVY